MITFFMFPQNENESSVFFYWWENKIYPPYLKKRSSSPYFEFRPVRTLEKIHNINSSSVLIEKYDLPFKQILLHILFKFVVLSALQSNFFSYRRLQLLTFDVWYVKLDIWKARGCSNFFHMSSESDPFVQGGKNLQQLNAMNVV